MFVTRERWRRERRGGIVVFVDGFGDGGGDGGERVENESANESAAGRARASREDGSLARVASTRRRARSRGGRVNDGFHATVESTSASGGGRSRSSTTRSGSRTSASRAATNVASRGCSSRSDSSPRGSASASARSRSVADTYAEALVEEVRAQLTALEGIKARHALPRRPPPPRRGWVPGRSRDSLPRPRPRRGRSRRRSNGGIRV